MATEVWIWQNGTASEDLIYAAAMGLDGSCVLAGNTRGHWSETNAGRLGAAVKLDADGTEVWRHQEGVAGSASFPAVAVDQEDGSTVLAGRIWDSVGNDYNFSVVKLDAEGAPLWEFQEGTSENDTVSAIAMAGDGSVVIVGQTDGDWGGANAGPLDFAAFRLDVNGTEVWTYQNGTELEDELLAAAMVDGGMSVVVAGYTSGDFSGSSEGGSDFVAIKLDAADGTEIWRYQDGSGETDYLTAIAAIDDDSVVLAGLTSGNWSGDNNGSADFAAVKLDSEGVEVWRYQDGTSKYDFVTTVAAQADGSILLGGWTGGDWSGVNAGNGTYDWAVVLLSADGEEEWRWQGGSTGPDYLLAMAAGSDGRVLLAGWTEGSWGQPNLGQEDFVAVMLTTNTEATIAPFGSLTATPTPTAGQAPTAAVSPGTPTPGGKSTTDSTPITIGVVSAVGAVVLGALGVWRWRHPTAKEKSGNSQPSPPVSGHRHPSHDSYLSRVSADESHHRSPDRIMAMPTSPWNARNKSVKVEESRGDAVASTSTAATTTIEAPLPAPAPAVAPEPAAALAAAAEARTLSPAAIPTPAAPTEAPPALAPPVPTPPAPLAVIKPVHSNQGRTTPSVASGGDALASGIADELSEEASLTTTSVNADVPMAERAELDQFHQGQTVVGAESSAEGSTVGDLGERGASSSAAGRRESCAGVGLGQAVLEAAEEVAHLCPIPGVSEAATVLSILVKMVSDSGDSGCDARLRQCRSIVMVLERAANVAGKGDETMEHADRVLVQDVHDAISDLVELIKTYQSKNRLSKVLTSTLFKRRQDELDAVVREAIARLQLGLQVQVGDDVSAVKEGIQAYQSSIADAKSQALAEARSERRQRKLEQVEIPEDQVVVTEELLGRGGFGDVFLADFNGRNAAAKVLYVNRDLGKRSDLDILDGLVEGRPDLDRAKRERKAFLRELDAMIHLRSPHTVNVFGAITSLQNRLVLVMELLAGGDLRTLLKNSAKSLPEDQCRRIIGDICAGMTFLHGKKTVHGDLKSANVLLDGAGRAKIGDFGTSRWSQHTDSTGLATYTTKSSQNTQMSLAWSAPEVLTATGSTYASDVYSYGIVAWEVFSRKLPWASVKHPREIYIRVVLNELRPDIPADTPADLAEMMKACWAAEAMVRPTFSALMKGIKSRG